MPAPKNGPDLKCKLCNKVFSSEISQTQHNESAKHTNKVQINTKENTKIAKGKPLSLNQTKGSTPSATNKETNMSLTRPQSANSSKGLKSSPSPSNYAETEAKSTFGQLVNKNSSVLPNEVIDEGDAINAVEDDEENDIGESNLKSYFTSKKANTMFLQSGISILGETNSNQYLERALIGTIETDGEEDKVEPIYLNTHEPFCMVAVGVQGAGKSHTMTCALESCLINFDDIIKLKRPQLTLVLHFGEGESSLCESMGLLKTSRTLMDEMMKTPQTLSSTSSSSVSLPSKDERILHVPKDKAVMLVSPAFYKQRKRFYENECEVRPLLFPWSSLSADHIKRIMRIQEGDNQLYVAALLNLLRRYQRQEITPNFQEFIQEVTEVCNVKGQDGPLKQRLNLLESLVAESEENEELVQIGGSLQQCCEPGKLILVDLTDNLLSKEEANGIFQVLVEQYRSLDIKGGKVLALDEAHKYMNGIKEDGLSRALVNTARLMRHDGMRLIVSTQSPLALAPELLELVSVALLHRFHSSDWFEYLKKKLPLNNQVWHPLTQLNPGNAILFAARHLLPNKLSLFRSDLESEGSCCGNLFHVSIRPRITEDYGASQTNGAK